MKQKMHLHILLFCYIFSFYVSVFPASMLIVAPLYVCVCVDKTYLSCFLKIWGNPYIFRCFCMQLFLVGFATFFPIYFRTTDFSLVILLITQVIHFISAVFFFAFLDYHKISFDELCNAFINIFIMQTFIQCIACMNPTTIGSFVRKFNRYEASKVSMLGSNVRGWALSAATTYHLSLVYGVAFIIYIRYLIKVQKITFWALLRGLCILVGIFFPGRTGFVGVGIGGLYFLLSTHISVTRKIVATGKLLCITGLVIACFLSFAPQKMRAMIVEQVIPYAFEFIYSKLETGKAQTASTNELKDMWNRDFEQMELVRGSGRYMDAYVEGRYYMRVDPGVLRHLLYGGVIFYSILIFYQVLLTFPFCKRKDYYVFFLIMIYFTVMDFKGVTIGMNKFAFSTCLLLGYSYTCNYGEKSHSSTMSVNAS